MILILAIGGLYVVHSFAEPAEDSLTYVEGVPSDVLVTNFGRTSVHFTVDGRPMDYSSDLPNYRQLMSAINGGDQLRVWGRTVTSKPIFFGSRQTFFQIYKVKVGETPIVAYAETISHSGSQTLVAFVIVGCLFAGIGAYAMLPGLLQRRKKLPDNAKTDATGVLDMLRAAEQECADDPANQQIKPRNAHSDADTRG